ncbi:hypothetical protein [Sulfuricaulis limicola]|uniref:hypothetical protein n=1 Tax=Sulfuricaulis limicola TaxID=1620215 RepID=UPI000BBAE8CA|nr:hypothetical protein [Sulfuricaulis limicola]
MSPSLIRIGAAKSRTSISSRLLVVWLSLSLFLTLTPCCEIFADALASPADAALDHAHQEPDGASHSPASNGFHDPCAQWLDRADYTLNSLHLAVSSGSGSQQDIPVAPLLLLVPHADAPVMARLSYHPPPDPTLPLYLRIKHLLL